MTSTTKIVTPKQPNKFDVLRFVKGRGKQASVIGFEGTLFWYKFCEAGYHNSGVDPYRSWYSIGLKNEKGEVAFGYLHNTTVVRSLLNDIPVGSEAA